MSDASFKQRKVLESLFNKYLNFNLTYEEYQSFMAGCLSDSSVSDSTLSRYRTYFTLSMTGGSGGGSMMLMNMENGGSVMQNMYSEGGENNENMQLLSGGMTILSAPPAGSHYLDACGCNNLLKAWESWTASPGSRTFEAYVNLYFPVPNPKALVDRCKEFYATDEDAVPTELASTSSWTSIQKANMEQYVQEDDLYLPDGFTFDIPCNEGRPNNPPEIRSGAPGKK